MDMNIVVGLSVATVAAASNYVLLCVGSFFKARAGHYDQQAQKVRAETRHTEAVAYAQELNGEIGEQQLEMQKNTLRLQTVQVDLDISKLRAKQEGKDYLDKLHAEHNDPLDA